MLRILTRLKPLPFCASFSLFREGSDWKKPPNDLHNVNDMTGWDKVKSIFYVDEFNNISHELNYVLQSTSLAIFTGMIYGGIISSRTAYIRFMENNQASVFENTFEAKKILQDKVTIALGKGALKWGWRLAIFTFSFSSIMTVMSTYRGEASVLDYTVAGLVTGSLYKLNGGLQACLVGGVLGTILATLGGIVCVGLLQISGTSMEDIRYWQYKFKESRQKYHNMAMENSSQGKSFGIEKSHDILIKDAEGSNSLNDIK